MVTRSRRVARISAAVSPAPSAAGRTRQRVGPRSAAARRRRAPAEAHLVGDLPAQEPRRCSPSASPRGSRAGSRASTGGSGVPAGGAAAGGSPPAQSASSWRRRIQPEAPSITAWWKARTISQRAPPVAGGQVGAPHRRPGDGVDGLVQLVLGDAASSRRRRSAPPAAAGSAASPPARTSAARRARRRAPPAAGGGLARPPAPAPAAPASARRRAAAPSTTTNGACSLVSVAAVSKLPSLGPVPSRGYVSRGKSGGEPAGRDGIGSPETSMVLPAAPGSSEPQ